MNGRILDIDVNWSSLRSLSNMVASKIVNPKGPSNPNFHNPFRPPCCAVNVTRRHAVLLALPTIQRLGKIGIIVPKSLTMFERWDIVGTLRAGVQLIQRLRVMKLKMLKVTFHISQ